MLVMNRACRTGKVIDFIHFYIQRKTYVMPVYFKIGVVDQVDYIALGAGEKVVDTYDIVTLFQQSFAKMAPQESRSACHNNSFHGILAFVKLK